MRIGIIGTGAIAGLHARAYRNLGFAITACTDAHGTSGPAFAAAHGAEYLPSSELVCRHPLVDIVDVCTLPDVRLAIVELCARYGKPVQVEKPIATNVETARQMIAIAHQAAIPLAVVSQHRFDESSRFLEQAIAAGRLGSLIQSDAYVKWYRPPEYYARRGKGRWDVEGGGALINQGIHQVDLLRWLAGPVRRVFGTWKIGGLHAIESEDSISAVLQYESGAAGVIQASTALWPGLPERLELHGTRGTAIVTGDRLTTWAVRDDRGEPPPVAGEAASGASDPLAISVDSFERQFRDFADAVSNGRRPVVAGEDGLAALELVDAIYQSCRTGQPVDLAAPAAP